MLLITSRNQIFFQNLHRNTPSQFLSYHANPLKIFHADIHLSRHSAIIMVTTEQEAAMEFSRQERLLELFFRGLRAKDSRCRRWRRNMMFPPRASPAASMISRRFSPITGRWLVMQSSDIPTRAGGITWLWRNFSAIRNCSP